MVLVSTLVWLSDLESIGGSLVDLVMESFRHSGHHCECSRKRTLPNERPNWLTAHHAMLYAHSWLLRRIAKDCQLFVSVPILYRRKCWTIRMSWVPSCNRD
ncbi:hypothetical protein HU200_044598 [Digitaria exilis]|uniref:Uncharacterized protein n=1 Tax=Digitaria exilis TaxID=1010633 RepID=A0A835B196_9POAL|nr:hypothetical protein HU200_044598 [Digitaria exilis]